MNRVAKIEPDGTVISFQNSNKGMTDDNGVQYPRNIWQVWSDDELNAIGYARFEEQRISDDKRSTGSTDTFADGRVTRTHTTKDYVPPPPPPDLTPTIEDPDNPAYVEEVPPVMEDVPAVMSEDGEEVITPATTREVKPATTISHPAGTLPNPMYNHVDLRKPLYPSTDDLIIALWEKVVEERPAAAAALEVSRQAIKKRFPKGE